MNYVKNSGFTHPFLDQIIEKDCKNPKVNKLFFSKDSSDEVFTVFMDDYLENPDKGHVSVAMSFFENPMDFFSKHFNAIHSYSEISNIIDDLIMIDREDIAVKFVQLHDSIFEAIEFEVKSFNLFADFFPEKIERDLKDILLGAVIDGKTDLVRLIFSKYPNIKDFPSNYSIERVDYTLSNFDTVNEIINFFPDFFDEFEKFTFGISSDNISNLIFIINKTERTYPLNEKCGSESYFSVFPMMEYLDRKCYSIPCEIKEEYFKRWPEFLKSREISNLKFKI